MDLRKKSGGETHQQSLASHSLPKQLFIVASLCLWDPSLDYSACHLALLTLQAQPRPPPEPGVWGPKCQSPFCYWLR